MTPIHAAPAGKASHGTHRGLTLPALRLGAVLPVHAVTARSASLMSGVDRVAMQPEPSRRVLRLGPEGTTWHSEAYGRSTPVCCSAMAPGAPHTGWTWGCGALRLRRKRRPGRRPGRAPPPAAAGSAPLRRLPSPRKRRHARRSGPRYALAARRSPPAPGASAIQRWPRVAMAKAARTSPTAKPCNLCPSRCLRPSSRWPSCRSATGAEVLMPSARTRSTVNPAFDADRCGIRRVPRAFGP